MTTFYDWPANYLIFATVIKFGKNRYAQIKTAVKCRIKRERKFNKVEEHGKVFRA